MSASSKNPSRKSMDANKQVNLTMTEIKEIIYQLEKVIETMETETSFDKADESGVRDEKKVMLQQIIQKLQS